MAEWEDYILTDYKIRFAPAALVLDVGCARADQMKALIAQDSSVIGIDVDRAALAYCRTQGLSVLCAYAEHVPLKDACLDGILCKVVLPYTREEQVIREFSRLLKPGGQCYLQCHGAGYYLKYLVRSAAWRQRVYGLRTLVNTWVWVATGRRLPGFLGDTIYQSRRRLAQYFQSNDFTLLEDVTSKRFLGFPVFTYMLCRKDDPQSSGKVACGEQH